MGRDRSRRWPAARRIAPALATGTLAVGAMVASASCGDIFHSTEWSGACDTDPARADCIATSTGPGPASSSSGAAGATTSSTAASSAGTGGAGGAGSAAGPTGAATTGAGGSTTVSSTSGGVGGAPVICGNGVIDPNEQCDDANLQMGDGCVGCIVQCSGAGEVLEPASLHCYRSGGTAFTWQGARSDCIAWGGDLAAIGTVGEQTFLQGFVGGDHWLGTSDAAVEGSFTWVTSEPFAYSNWAAGEPNDSGGEDCAELYGPANGFAWNDLSCDAALPALCERPPPDGP
jgi:cysteine-rich repeat protein